MELKLEQLIHDLERVSNVRNLDDNNPMVMRFSHPTNATVHVIVCAISEPSTLILPLNVTWFVYDPQHPYYRKALQRTSKDPDTVHLGFDHTWILVDEYEDVFVDQVYDEDDEALLSDNSQPVAATTSTPGIARLSVAASVPSNPVVVGDNDPRLTDARTPLPHTHPQTPATMLQTSQGIVTISASSAPVAGATIVATSATTAVWRKLNSSEIETV